MAFLTGRPTGSLTHKSIRHVTHKPPQLPHMMNNNPRTASFSGHVYDRNSSVDTVLSSLLCDDRSSLRSTRHSAAQSTPPRSPPRSPSAPPFAHVIRYLWDRNYSQGLELGRLVTTTTPAAARQALIPVYWRPGTDTLGITLDVETTTKQIIVTYSTRRDLRAGSILLRIASQQANEANFHTLLLAAKAAKGVTTCLEFVPPPPPVVVKKSNFQLATLGVDRDAAFELVAVDGCCIRYLSLQDINQRIHGNAASSTCEMVFERMAKQLASDKNNHQRKTRSVSDDAITSNSNNRKSTQTAGVGAALAAVATIAGAMA